MTARSVDVPPADQPPSLQTRLEVPAPDLVPADVDIADPAGLFRSLEASGRFHRDTGLGRIFHPDSVSLREHRPTDSLHIVVHRDQIRAHVDRVSPLHLRSARNPGYSLRRTAAHNLSGMAQDLGRLVRGRQGDHRSQLDCRWLWNPSASAPDPGDLLDPVESAWSLQIEARVSGKLDEPRLQRALAGVLGSRPANHETLLVLDCPDDDSLDLARSQLQAAPVPVSEWPPLRARLARHPGGDILMLNVNHAAADGVGALQVLRSIARSYAGGDDPGAPLEFLAVRDLPVQPASAPVPPWMAWGRGATERLRDLLARPAHLAPDQAGGDQGYGFRLVRLSAGDTRRVVDADRPGTSRNILLAALHLTVAEWNVRHGAPDRRIAVLVQVDLRPPEWDEAVVANISVTARVTTSRRHRTDQASALEAVKARTTRNRRTRSGIALIAALDRSGLLPLWAKQSQIVLQPLTRNRLTDSAMLTNLGSLPGTPDFGGDAGETIDLWFSAPSRSPRTLCIGAATISGRLHLVFRYPRRVLGPDAARRFADMFVDQALLVAASRPSGPTA